MKPKKFDLGVTKGMSLEDKAILQSKLAKRANVRMKSLELSGLRNDSYTNAAKYLESIGRNKARFTESKKWLSNEALDMQLSVLADFLNSKTSTVGGAHKVTHTRSKEHKDFSYSTLSSMSLEEKQDEVKRLAKKANARLNTLEKNGKTNNAYEMAMKSIQRMKRNNSNPGKREDRFYTGTAFKNEHRLDWQLRELRSFLNAETSTMRGIKALVNRRIKSFTDKGINVGDPETFYDFLTSKQFAALGAKDDSNQVVEDYGKAIDEGFTPDEIEEEYQKYLNSNMTFEQIEERRQEILKEHGKNGGLMR